MKTITELLRMVEEYDKLDLCITLVNSKGDELTIFRPKSYPNRYDVIYNTDKGFDTFYIRKLTSRSLFRNTGIKPSDRDWSYGKDMFDSLEYEIDIRCKAINKLTPYKAERK